MNQKSLALTFTAIMLVGALPAADATHTDPLVPDIPVLPNMGATEDCFPVGVSEDILARVQQAAAGDPAFYKDPLGVPSICVDGIEEEWKGLIRDMNRTLEDLRRVTREIQRQVDQRIETTLPDGAYPNDLVRPRTVLLNDTFNGYRNTGFGDWKVVTERGEDPAWEIRGTETPNGTRYGYHFGDDTGYERGIHQWLVSPEIDMTALKGNQTAVEDITYARQLARDQLYTMCNTFTPNGKAADGQGTFAFVCGRDRPLVGGGPVLPPGSGAPVDPSLPDAKLDMLVTAYEAAIDEHVYSLPVMQHGAFLDLTYRLNMAPNQDGVRLWIYSGDRQPDRSVLFQNNFGVGDVGDACVHYETRDFLLPDHYRTVNAALQDNEDSEQDPHDLTCSNVLRGGQVISPPAYDFPGMAVVEAFSSGALQGTSNRTGFTGEIRDPVTQRLNLTPWMEDRIWILFEVKTKSNERGGDIFEDPTMFPWRQDFGFELVQAYAEGEAYHRNFRLKDVAATYPYIAKDNPYGDNATRVRTTVPPGNEPVVVWLHNAGDYWENGTLTLNVRETIGTSTRNAGSYNTTALLRPDEVKTITVHWGQLIGRNLTEGALYTIDASLEETIPLLNGTNVLDQTATPVGEFPSASEPNATRVQPPNAAETEELNAGDLEISQPIRAATLRDIKTLRADGARGPAIQVCSSVEGTKCSEHYAGRKGEPREVLVGIRNDGNAPQDITVILSASNEGVDKPDIIRDGGLRVLRDVLPGESRAVQWTVTPSDPGAYRLVVSTIREGETAPKDPNAERRMFVQRSTGIICLDTIEERECGSSFVGTLVPELRGETITAAVAGPDGTLYVVTEIKNPVKNRHSGQLAALDPATDTWRVLANLSNSELTKAFKRNTFGSQYGPIRDMVVGPEGELYLVGDRSTVLRYNATDGALTRLKVNHTAPGLNVTAFHITSGAWHDGTLVVVGHDGRVGYLQNETIEQFRVRHYIDEDPEDELPPSNITGTYWDALATPYGQLLAFGSDGIILTHSDKSSIGSGWQEALVEANITLASRLGERTLQSATIHGSRLYIAAEDTLYVSERVTKASEEGGYLALHASTLPAPVLGHEVPLRVYTSHDNELHLITGDYNGFNLRNTYITRCSICDIDGTTLPDWTYLTPARASLITTSGARPAKLSIGVAAGDTTYLLGESGHVAPLVRGGEYDNMLDWTTVPSLAPRDGGVLRTVRSESEHYVTQEQTILLVPDDHGAALAAQASRFQLSLNHSMNETCKVGCNQQGNTIGTGHGEVRILYRTLPDLQASQAPRPLCSQQMQGPVRTACFHEYVRWTLERFDTISPDGWQYELYRDIAPAQPVANPIGGVATSSLAYLWGVEVYIAPRIQWAIDDIRLQGFVNGTWQDITYWKGPSEIDGNIKGQWFVEDVAQAAFYAFTPLGAALNATDATAGGTYHGARTTVVTDPRVVTAFDQLDYEPLWVESNATFGIDTFSPWHITTQYADRPVFAANNEQYKEGFTNPSAPRLLSNWDSRLVSPVIDLRDAYDPAISFRHTYAFRLQAYDVPLSSGDESHVNPGDGGVLELQYLLQGPDCGVEDESVTCGWSRFYIVEPDGGYPSLEDHGFEGAIVDAGVGSDGYGLVGQDISYWGRIAPPDATGAVQRPRDTSAYEEVRVTLDERNAVCGATELKAYERGERPRCVPANLTGRQVRFAFHLLTTGVQTEGDAPDNIFNETVATASNRVGISQPGEGWYVTDFKVLGARKLGIDLRASNLTFRVGYDVGTIGVGPGTRVPVNVTVDNRGTFDALGYTGRLEVRKVIDSARKITELVDTIILPQQPTIQPGARVNHTLFWNVPAFEGVNYSLTFHLDPIGIDRDEDFLDNAVTLGTVARPILAKTFQRYDVEFRVSPENATTDITRYIPPFINNTGNVPLEGFTIERRILALSRSVGDEADDCAQWEEYVRTGKLTAIVACDVWTTARPAPAGALTPLTTISDDLDPTADLFWKAPEPTNFRILLAGTTQIGGKTVTLSAEKTVAAFATYFFDDVEGGPRGESTSGKWIFGPGWNSSQPGFRSTDAYSFGDIPTDRYPANANASFVSPVIDLGSARTATIGFYQDYSFEKGFDGGLIELSDDGGKTWTPVTPIMTDPTSTGYNTSFPIQPSSVLHPTKDPDQVAYGFTASSSLLPSSVEDWVLTQVDLTSYANVTEPGVEYAGYHYGEIAGYASTYGDTPAAWKGYPVPAPRVPKTTLYRHDQWCVGSLDKELGGCWEVQNITEAWTSPVPPRAGQKDNKFWWSGSMSIDDDGLRPLTNNMLQFGVNLAGVDEDEIVIAEWWEYHNRFASKAKFQLGADPAGDTTPNVPDINKLLSFHTFHPGGEIPPTYRFNLSAPVVLESKGQWYHMQSDITGLVNILKDAGRPLQMNVGFAYTPHKKYSTEVDNGIGEAEDLNALSNSSGYAPDGPLVTTDRLLDDRGFAIDGFNVRTVRFAGGAQLGQPTYLLTEAQSESRTRANIVDCGVGSVDRVNPPSRGWTTASDQHAPCLDENSEYTVREPPTSAAGRNWNLVSSMPGVRSGWYAVPIRDHANHTAAQPPPTGLDPYAWYTGELQCAGGTTTCQTTDPADDCMELAFNAQSKRDGPTRCLQPNSEARLITPVFDLAAIAGNNAQLSFWHRFAFHQQTKAGDIPLSSGGVIEIQTYDEQTKAWSPWKQLYDGPFNVGPNPKVAARDQFEPGRGGYTGVTANTSLSGAGESRFDPPFESVMPDDFDRPVQFLFTGSSATIDAGSHRPADQPNHDGWLREEFDVSGYLGQKVRFGFHYAMSAHHASSQRAVYLNNTDGGGAGSASNHDDGDKAGWWVTDIAVVGDVIVGKPIQLRLRAGTDGNVEEGHWLVDDLGVYGSRYGDNVGLFVDQTPGKFGALNGTTATMPVTVRNLGDSVRRDLAIEIRKDGKTDVAMSASGETVTIDGTYYIRNITLGPGQSKTIVVNLTAPKQLGSERTVDYILTLVEEIPSKPIDDEARYNSIKDNEVRGFLQREVTFHLQDKPAVSPPKGSIALATPKLNETVTMVLTTQNTGYAPATLNLSCVARTITRWEPMDHSAPGEDTPIVAAEYPCTMSGQLTLASKEWTAISFSAVPTKAGYLQFSIKGNVVGGDNFSDTRRIAPVGIAVGVPAAAYSADFSRKEETGNFTGNGLQWSHLRGANAPGSLLIGVNESVAGTQSYASACGGGICRVRSQNIDLHNFSTSSPAFLSFWHMDRLARHDGWQVRASYLENEDRPNQGSSWSQECILRPMGEYEGAVRQIPTDQSETPPKLGDTNPIFAQHPYAGVYDRETPVDFFVADAGTWEESWSLAVFDLTKPCKSVRDTNDGEDEFRLVGRTVRLYFIMAPGAPDGAPGGANMMRGHGHGVLLDDITIGPYALTVRPDDGQSAFLLDNTTKRFHVMVDNKGATSDVVVLSFDAANSSAPSNSVIVPSEPVSLLPGESKAIPVEVTLPRDSSLLPTEFNARVIAKSLIDKVASGASDLELVFGPRPWPELSVSVEPPVGLVQEGTETFIPITIENLGLVASPDTRVTVVDEWLGGRAETVFELSSIPSYIDSPDEASRTLEFRWRPEKGSIGVHNLSFVVDPEGLVEQYTRTNDRASLNVVVSDLLIPDLHLAEIGALRMRNAVGGTVSPALDADVARYEVTAGELVSFELKVANRGRAGATNVDVRAFIGSLSLPAKTIPYIAPGGEVVVNFNWLAQKGEHEIEFIARSEQVELTTDNNRYPGKGVTILTVKGYEIVVEIPTLDLLLEPASEIRVPFKITNNGNAGEDLELRAKAPKGMQLALPREGFFLRAGETYEDTARLILAAEAVAGEQFISIDAVARENPMKVASGRAPVRVNASYGGNIAGGFAFGAPPTLAIPIELVNEGNSLEPWTIDVQLPAGWSAKETIPAKVVVPAHDRTVYKLQVSLPESTAPGERAIAVKATMANGDTREGAVRATVLPLRAAGVTLSEAAPVPDKGSLSIPIVVENKGNIQQPFSVLLTEVPAGVELRVEPSTFDLAPGATAVAALIVKPNETVEAGTYAITGYTRFEGVIPRSTEGLANVQTLRVPIVRQDLVLSQLEFTPRAELDAGDRVSVKVSVQNRGAAPLSNVPVHLYVDDVFIDEGTLATVPAGARADVTFNWTATDGVHTLTAVVDPYEDTVDADRADNAVSTLASVGVDVPTGGIAAGRADAPFPGAVGLFAALAAALLLTRGYGSWRRERR